ncbi:MAG: hypothetical protein CME39_09790 [Haliea sp.]|nr:hypothetical protein [Haliea sp.]
MSARAVMIRGFIAGMGAQEVRAALPAVVQALAEKLGDHEAALLLEQAASRIRAGRVPRG